MNNISLRLKVFMVILIVIITIGTLGFMLTEGLSFYDAFYFSIVTVATVGYGDISPATGYGKILSVFLIITGVGTFLGVVANATDMLLNRHAQKKTLEKLNMVIGAFFTEAGTRFLTFFVNSDPTIEEISSELIITEKWTEKQFNYIKDKIKGHDFLINIDRKKLDELRAMLNDKGNIFLRLLENPSILENETFTDLLRAFLHLKEELLYRGDFGKLPDADIHHLTGDIKRAYSLLAYQWLDYIRHLKEHYPYLFSLAVRMNPFDKKRSPVVR